ncbi:hypothetical protein BP6252_07020 [Coleophoma cylindrospora]|uniref:DUF7721 domain-containing protein n=1 Tax=Coleophoma cylindrospora TaxID=1849047 RepID=A0A3D8RGB8_9HELO|nr:hypothetical protein BP6252_07020 [Coleophoma cylindrospora]
MSGRDYDDNRGGYGGDRQEDYGSGRGGYGGGNEGYGGGNERHGGGNEGYGGGRQEHRPQQNYGGGGGYAGGDDDDLSGAQHHAEQHAGNEGDRNIFSNVLGMLGQNKQNIGQGHVNEEEAVQSHQQFFGGGGGYSQPAESSSMGQAAAMQALKMFTGGQSGNSAGGNSQNAFIGMAMGEASKLFEQQSAQGNVASGASKESAIQQAGEMALKMYMKSQGGNAGGLMSLASKFM